MRSASFVGCCSVIDDGLKKYIISALRRISYRAPARTIVLNRAKRDRGIYQCATCLGLFKRPDFCVDHIHTVIPVSGWVDWNSYFSRLFCSASDLQVLCKICHKAKTKLENAERRKPKKRIRK